MENQPSAFTRWSNLSIIGVYEILIIVLAIALAQPDSRSLLMGTVISSIGLILRIWTRGYEPERRKIAVFGPYKYVRHPHHLGTFLMLLGYCMGSRSFLVTLTMLIGCIILFRHIFKEEGDLLGRHGGASYKDYRLRVPTFVPNLTPYRGTLLQNKTFSLARSMLKGQKREFESIVASAFVFLLMFGLMKVPDAVYWRIGLSVCALVYGALSLGLPTKRNYA